MSIEVTSHREGWLEMGMRGSIVAPVAWVAYTAPVKNGTGIETIVQCRSCHQGNDKNPR